MQRRLIFSFRGLHEFVQYCRTSWCNCLISLVKQIEGISVLLLLIWTRRQFPLWDKLKTHTRALRSLQIPMMRNVWIGRGPIGLGLTTSSYFSLNSPVHASDSSSLIMFFTLFFSLGPRLRRWLPIQDWCYRLHTLWYVSYSFHLSTTSPILFYCWMLLVHPSDLEVWSVDQHIQPTWRK